MRRPKIGMLVLIGLISVVGVGFLGYRSVQAQVEPTTESPPTVPVSRGDVQQTISAPGRFVSAKEIYLGMGVNGSLAEIYVKPGDSVEAGQYLAQLSNEEELIAAVEDARAELTAARMALDELIDNAPLVTAQAQLDLANARDELRIAAYKNWVLQEGHRASSETIAAAKAEVALAMEGVRNAERAFNAVAGLPEDNPSRANARLQLAEARQRRDQALAELNWYLGHPTELQQAVLDAKLAVAEANLALAEQTWEHVKEGPDPVKLAELEARVSRAEAQLTNAEADLAGLELRAPFDGVIMEVNAKVGDTIAANSDFILLSDLSSLEVVVTVIEEDLPQVEVGQFVDLYFDARPDVEGIGEVERIVPKRLSGDRPLYAVYISIDELPDGLAPGMTVDASIIISRREGVLRLPKALVRARSNGIAKIEVWLKGLREERTVHVGLLGDSYVEILSGLSEGVQVIGE
jgi:multidrug efflux pump subunit AcrA (membrane-fusion protein)